MSMIENHLRDALREVADDIPASAVPPLHLPGSRPRRGGAGQVADHRHFFSSRWLAPVAAAAAVLAIAAGVTAVAGLNHGASGPQQAAAAAAVRAVPPYYIALTGTRPPYQDHRRLAGIYATATGALIASVAVPRPYTTFAGVSAAADDRTFAVAAEAYPAGRLPAVKFFLVRFNPVSRATRLVALAMPRVPARASFDGFALSPHARRLAVAFEPNGAAPRLTEEVRVLDITTGATRTWTSSQGAVAGGTPDARSLSWADNDITLALNWIGCRRTDRAAVVPALSGVRLLNTRKPGTDLVAASRLAVRLYNIEGHPSPTGLVPGAAMLTANGRRVVAAVTTRPGTTGGFAEFSAATGRLLGKLGWRSLASEAAGVPMNVLWASKSGSTLLVGSPPGHPGQLAIIRGTRVALLPSSSRITFPAAAW